MTGMPGPGQTWAGAALVFVAIWIVMMVAMMLPSLLPVLRRTPHVATLAAGYFFVWAVFGALAYLVDSLLRRESLHSATVAHVLSIAPAAALVCVGFVQFTTWKLRHLACCRECAPATPGAQHAWRDGIRLGLHCCQCCVALMTLLFVIGMMNVWAMALVAILISLERLLPRPVAVVRAIGVLIVVLGTILTVHGLS